MVKNLCASQKYHKMDFFLTFTCNQSEHFGVKNVKNWIDGNLWKDYFPEFHYFSLDQQIEIIRGVEQSAAGILLRNWMEVRKLLINYLYDSPSSPYEPVEIIFSRDEYQGEVGNLSHIHMMISMNMDELNEHQQGKIDDLIRASIVDIVRVDEVSDLIDEGIFKSFHELEDLIERSEEILPHHFSPRCLRCVSAENRPDSFVCWKQNNLKMSPDNRNIVLSLYHLQSNILLNV